MNNKDVRRGKGFVSARTCGKKRASLPHESSTGDQLCSVVWLSNRFNRARRCSKTWSAVGVGTDSWDGGVRTAGVADDAGDAAEVGLHTPAGCPAGD